MALVDVLIPQMGEGLQEVVIIGFQKQPGDTINRDDLLYSMETDKAVMEVESPYSGVLKEWLAEEGAILPIGAPIARIETTADHSATTGTAASNGTTAETGTTAGNASGAGNLIIPPRTRAYCREKNISEDEMLRIPAATGKLMPSDVDAYLAAQAKDAIRSGVEETPEAGLSYTERPLSTHQRVFIYRIKRSAQVVVPAVAKRSLEWGSIRRHAESLRAQGGELQPSTFLTFAYCVVQAVKEQPRFRSALIGEATIREYEHVNIGIAVGLPNGELTTAVVPAADTMDFATFVRVAQENIQKARDGENQASDTTQLLLTYMGPYEITDAIPVLVAPAVGTLFIGASFEQNGETLVNLSLTFDHRLIQGIEAAEFLKAIVTKTRQVEQLG